MTRAVRAAMRADDLEDALGQVGRQRGGHLVEHQDVGSMASARARSMTRSVASGRSRARSDRSRPASPSSRQPVAEGVDRGPGQAQVGGDVQVRDERRLLVDRTIPPRRASAGEWATYGWPRTRIVPVSGRTAPVRILTSVLLPAPLAPMSAWTSPGRTASEAERRAATAP